MHQSRIQKFFCREDIRTEIGKAMEEFVLPPPNYSTYHSFQNEIYNLDND